METRAARLRLKPRPTPYFVRTGKKGLVLGYRRTASGSGTWVAKRYQGRAETGGQYVTSAFAQADDFADADGASVLDYHQAVERLQGELSEVQKRSRYTVEQAVADYVAWLRNHRRSANDTEGKLRAYLVEYFRGRLVSDLTREDFDRWDAWAQTYRPPGRRKAKTVSAKPPAGKEPPDPVEVRRRRQSTLNRVKAAVKACLNHAVARERVASDAAWRRIKKAKNVDRARTRWLDSDECTRLVNACAPDFRRIVQAGILTGARWSELRRARVEDFDLRSKTLLIATSKSGHPRRIPLTDEGEWLLDDLTAGRARTAAIFLKEDGNPWALQDGKRPMRAACGTAKIEPAIGFHALRHTYASQLVQAGVSLAIVAEALGHVDTRMVSKHYGHLAPSHVAEAIRANLPKIGLVRDGTVQRIRK